MSIKEASNEKLLQKIAYGDELAFTTLYYRHRRKIFTFCYYILQSEQRAEEVVQDVMLKLWVMGEKACEIKNFDSWLRQVSKNRAIDLLRKQEVDNVHTENIRRINSEDSLNYTEEEVLMRDARRLLDEGIANLPEQQRKVYICIEKEGLDVHEVAKLLNIQVSTTHSHLKLARKALKIHLSKYFDLIIVGLILKFF